MTNNPKSGCLVSGQIDVNSGIDSLMQNLKFLFKFFIKSNLNCSGELGTRTLLPKTLFLLVIIKKFFFYIINIYLYKVYKNFILLRFKYV